MFQGQRGHSRRGGRLSHLKHPDVHCCPLGVWILTDDGQLPALVVNHHLQAVPPRRSAGINQKLVIVFDDLTQWPLRCGIVTVEGSAIGPPPEPLVPIEKAQRDSVVLLQLLLGFPVQIQMHKLSTSGGPARQIVTQELELVLELGLHRVLNLRQGVEGGRTGQKAVGLHQRGVAVKALLIHQESVLLQPVFG